MPDALRSERFAEGDFRDETRKDIIYAPIHYDPDLQPLSRRRNGVRSDHLEEDSCRRKAQRLIPIQAAKDYGRAGQSFYHFGNYGFLGTERSGVCGLFLAYRSGT